MDRTLALMLVFFGGGTGCLLRYLTAPDPNDPFMLANIVACLVIGVLYALTRYKVFTNLYWQSFVTMGLLGGLSTFTPLTTYAIVQSEPIFIMSFLWFIAYLAAFFGISLIGYIPAALYCSKVLKMQPVPSIAAVMRSNKKKRSKRLERKEQELKSKQYAGMLKELMVAKEMLAQLKEQTATLGELAKRNPQAAREYAKAKSKVAELQKTLQIQQSRLTQLDPLKGLAPDGLESAPGFADEKQNKKERDALKQAGKALKRLNKEEEAEAQAKAKAEAENAPSISKERAEEAAYFGEFGSLEYTMEQKVDPEMDSEETKAEASVRAEIKAAVKEQREEDEAEAAKAKAEAEAKAESDAKAAQSAADTEQAAAKAKAKPASKAAGQAQANGKSKSKPAQGKGNSQQSSSSKYPAKPKGQGKSKRKR